MNKQVAQITEVLETRYGARVAGLAPFYEEADKAVYRVDRSDGAPREVRL